MKQAKKCIVKLLYPPVWIICTVPTVAFALLIYLFATDQAEGTPANIIFCLSAYSLIILGCAVPSVIAAYRQWKINFLTNSPLIHKISRTHFGRKFINSPAFRGSVSLYRGMLINFLYMIFRIVTGIMYGSVWFLSMAAYYLVLGLLRTYLILCHRKMEQSGERNTAFEYGCYRRVAGFLTLLNIPMGGMIVMMITTNSGFAYPGYVIYLSAIYTFLIFGFSIRNLSLFRKVGSPILSAAQALNFVAAVMSVLGLQTAMIAHFSTSGEPFRRMMNAITGGCVYAVVIGTAVYMMIIAAKKLRKSEEARRNEQIGE